MEINKLKKTNFSKYFITSIAATILSTILLWFFVDVLHLLASLMSIFISGLIFFFKFFSYNKLKMFNDNKSNFLKYTIIWVIIISLTALLLLVFVDLMHFWVVVVNPIISIFMFIFRFYLFRLFNLLAK